jgi:transposase InsO family protein
MPRIGTRKLYYLIKDELIKQNIKLGRDVLFNFLRAEHLLIKPKRSYAKTTNSKHWMKKYPNLIKEMEVTKPEQLWVSDITYIQTNGGHNYLSLITDAYSKKIMGYELLDNLTTAGPLKALESALKSRKYKHDLVHHSDRGLQYCSAEYVNKLIENNVKISMTENGDPYENAIAERLNGILKYEFLIKDGFKNHLEAVKVIKESIKIFLRRLSFQNLSLKSYLHRQQKIHFCKFHRRFHRQKLPY